MQTGRALIKANPAVERGVRAAWRTAMRARRPGQLRRFLAEEGPRWLILGAGYQHRDEWLATDLFPTSRDTMFLDATRSFPFPDGSIDRILCEHMIEHLEYADGRHLLRECRRVLRPGGRLRIATPNLDNVLSLGDPDAELDDYIRWSNDQFGADVPRHRRDEAVYAINRMFHEWGHRFLYDPETLRTELDEAGFSSVTEAAVGESDDLAFAGIDFHGEAIPDAWNRFETMVFEADRAAVKRLPEMPRAVPGRLAG